MFVGGASSKQMPGKIRPETVGVSASRSAIAGSASSIVIGSSTPQCASDYRVGEVVPGPPEVFERAVVEVVDVAAAFRQSRYGQTGEPGRVGLGQQGPPLILGRGCSSHLCMSTPARRGVAAGPAGSGQGGIRGNESRERIEDLVDRDVLVIAVGGHEAAGFVPRGVRSVRVPAREGKARRQSRYGPTLV